MPVISYFFGIYIRMYNDDHNSLKNDGILKPYVSSLYSVSEVNSEFYLTDLGSE